MKDRYILEAVFLPQLLQEHGAAFISRLLAERGKMLVDMMNFIMRNEPEPYQCPYTPEDFVISARKYPSEDRQSMRYMLRIGMPKAEACPDCACIYMMTDNELANPAYYTVEKSIGTSWMLCGWDNESHLNYGSCPATEKEIVEKIKALYEQLLAERKQDDA